MKYVNIKKKKNCVKFKNKKYSTIRLLRCDNWNAPQDPEA